VHALHFVGWPREAAGNVVRKGRTEQNSRSLWVRTRDSCGIDFDLREDKEGETVEI
jgi:hypothetical protein